MSPKSLAATERKKNFSFGSRLILHFCTRFKVTLRQILLGIALLFDALKLLIKEKILATGLRKKLPDQIGIVSFQQIKNNSFRHLTFNFFQLVL